MLNEDFTCVGDDASTQVKVFTESSFMELAVEQFLGKSEDDVKVWFYIVEFLFIMSGRKVAYNSPPATRKVYWCQKSSSLEYFLLLITRRD